MRWIACPIGGNNLVLDLEEESLFPSHTDFLMFWS